ncbi:MAG: Cna B-type domain-containing protein, partial [Clostridia bacterium]|nr:Cna B-type domain-containing protein [Clostridia bacterium]
MMNYFSKKKKWMACLILMAFVFSCIMPTNLATGNSVAWAGKETGTDVSFYDKYSPNKSKEITFKNTDILVSKKGNKNYIVWTKDELSAAEKESVVAAIRERSEFNQIKADTEDTKGNVRFVNGESYTDEDVTVKYAVGNVTITFRDKSTWSLILYGKLILKTEATVTKVWDDNNNQDGKRPASLTVTLSNGTEVTLNEGNGWTATVTDLPKYANGQEIKYTWTETMPEGYTQTNTSVNGTVTTLTNSYSPEKTSATVTKVWNDNNNQDGKRPASLKVTLSDGTEVTLNEGNSWTATVTDLPKYADGEEIEYTWTENTMPAGYSLTGTNKEGTVTTITNSYDPEKTSATVKKVWNDNDNQDGKRPTELKVTLSNGTKATLNEGNSWTATVTDLPKYADGEEIEYTWTENT